MLTVFYSIFSHWYQKNTKIRCAALISGQEISDRNGFNSTVSLKIEQQLSISTYQFHVQPPMHDFVTFFVRSSQIHVRTLRHSKYNCSLASFLIFSSASAEREIVPIVANASSFHFFSAHIWMRISMWKNINIISISTWKEEKSFNYCRTSSGHRPRVYRWGRLHQLLHAKRIRL